MPSCPHLFNILLFLSFFLVTLDLFMNLLLFGSRLFLFRSWFRLGTWLIFTIWLWIWFITLWHHLSTTVMLLSWCFQLGKCFLDFFFGTIKSFFWVWIRLKHDLGIIIMLLHLYFFLLLLLSLAGLLISFAPLFLFSDFHLIDTLVFFSLDASLFLAIKIEAVGASFCDYDLSRDIITSSDSLITN